MERKEMNRCTKCGVYLRVMASSVPTCCPWYEKNVPSGKKSLEDCTAREPVKPDDSEVDNTFESEEDYDDEE